MAISGSKKVDLTIESVLERITPLQIYSYYMPNKEWKLNEVVISPFPRPGKGIEKNPSFLIGNKYGDITHIDYGMPQNKGDCFSFVKQLHSLPNLDSILRLIDRDFNLGISEGKEVESGPRDKIITPEVTKRNSLIQVITRKFTKTELDYWSSYYQDIEDLKRENVYSIKKLYLNKQLFSLPENELRFGYYFDGFWKLYCPNATNKRKKWLTNAPLTFLDGKDNIKDCEIAWVTKSKKEKMVLLKLYNCVISTQNESLACFSQENVEFIVNNSKKQVILYDSDDAGVRACQQITAKYPFGYCNPPRKYLGEGIKDFSDLARIHGIKAIEEHFKEKGIL